MKSQSAFALFEAKLGKEHRTRTDSDIEAGFVELPKPRRAKKCSQPQEKIRGNGAPQRINGNVTLSVDVPPRFTAAAALTAEREGCRTDAVAGRWLKHVALHEARPSIDPEVQVAVKIAIGGTISQELYDELEGIAAEVGVHPGCLAAQYIREGLAAEKAREDSPK